MEPEVVTAELSLERTEWMATERVRAVARLHNGSGATLACVNPDAIPTSPVLLVEGPSMEPAGFFEELPHGSPGFPVDVAPGHELQRALTLTEVVGALMPGRYAVQAAYAWEGGQALSEPVAIEVQPACPVEWSCAPIKGTWSVLSHVAWLHAPSEEGPYELCLSELSSGGVPSLGNTRVLARYPHRVVPVVAVPPDALSVHRCVGFCDDRAFGWVRIGPAGTTPIRRVELPAPARVLGPMLMQAESRAFLAVLAWPARDNAGTELSVLHVADDDGCDLTPPTNLEGFQMHWGTTAAMSQSDRRCVLVGERGGRLEVEIARFGSWGGLQTPEVALSLNGRFLAAAGMLARNGDLHVAVAATERRDPANAVFVLRTVALGPAGPPAMGPAIELPLADGWEASAATVGVDEAGAPWALVDIRSDSESTTLLCGPGRETAPSAVGAHPDAAFAFRYGTRPVLVRPCNGPGFELIPMG